ncbi:helix-turn-helix domain-containing protein [Acidaminobacter sp. JC074]|uniref:helix-turn-helix domain-containing protein n=1 Tax=Acidaminobacter sp. JC074 TaxID=2530199 RepID=UPI001F0F1EAF|nr:response regulator transcription factor [Acidaminobacter sp. JC074]MCH4889864.1 helix-turn-helix domain-containing protein [Acidaminobacter sp. JC074]
MEKMLHIKTITDIHKLLGDKKADHPLITVIDVERIAIFDKADQIKYRTDCYTIALKNGGECEIKYGRQTYDFTEGSLVFTKPGQVSEIESDGNGKKPTGWILCFHRDLLRGSDLLDKMGGYTYFDYSNNEALHLSEKEKLMITSIKDVIETEFSQNLDVYSNKLILSNLETLLNYCERFYGRQFITRSPVIKEGYTLFDKLLRDRLSVIEDFGIPTVAEFAEKMGYSTNYFSDMILKETGRRPGDHIHDAIIDMAKNLLLGTDQTVADIAYGLGYNYPGHFSKFFKKKVGLSPKEYRLSQ